MNQVKRENYDDWKGIFIRLHRLPAGEICEVLALPAYTANRLKLEAACFVDAVESDDAERALRELVPPKTLPLFWPEDDPKDP